MSHFGILCPGAIGHLNPMCAIGRELQRRGHQVTIFGVPDILAKVTSAGLEFAEIGAGVFPLGRIDQMYRTLGEMSGITGLQYTIQWLQTETAMLCAEAPAAIQARQIDLLIIDQITPIGSTIADYLKIPFVTVCNALPINREPGVPPYFTNWTYQNNLWARLRNQLGNGLIEYLTRNIRQAIDSQRRTWQMPPLTNAEAAYSTLAQICQLPPGFDFPREHSAACLHYTGPLQEPSGNEPITFAGVDFPFDRLTTQPLIYASLGTLQNRKWEIFQCIAAACADLDSQLVISLGNPQQNPAELDLPGQPIVVPYAPHQQLIARSSLVITHGGMNTVIGSLSAGVPLVVIPITNEQPGIATRLVRTGAGEMMTLQRLNTAQLRRTIVQVLQEASYRANAQRMQTVIQSSGGVRRAADIILAVCSE